MAERLERAAQALAAAAAALGQPEWERHTRALAATAPAPAPRVPTYRDVAVAGLDLVDALADGGRWDEADVQASHLSRFFSDPRAAQPAITRYGFDGLRAAARARDRDELADFLDVLREIFGPAGE